MSQWKVYDGSDEQINEIEYADHGWIVKWSDAEIELDERRKGDRRRPAK